MFEQAGPGQRAVLGHMTNHQEGGSGTPRRGGEQRGALANLGHASGRRLHPIAMHGLNGIDQHQIRGQFFPMPEQRLHPGLGQKADIPGHLIEAIGAQPDLRRALLTADVEHLAAPGLNPAGHLKAQGGLAHPGFAPEQGHRTRDRAAPQNAIEFAYSARQPGQIPNFHLAQRHGLISRPGNRLSGQSTRSEGFFPQ